MTFQVISYQRCDSFVKL